MSNMAAAHDDATCFDGCTLVHAARLLALAATGDSETQFDLGGFYLDGDNGLPQRAKRRRQSGSRWLPTRATQRRSTALP